MPDYLFPGLYLNDTLLMFPSDLKRTFSRKVRFKYEQGITNVLPKSQAGTIYLTELFA